MGGKWKLNLAVLFMLAAAAFTMTACTNNKDSGNEETPTTVQQAQDKIDTSDTSDDLDGKKDSQSQTANDNSTTKKEEQQEMLTGKHHIEISVQDYGNIELELDADVAPVTVTNFINLANLGFYDGLTFHRIQAGFVIQGGDPLGTGMGGAEQTITGEFASNGIENSISHVRGTISMARSKDYNSASSQFFICVADATSLDGEYAAFGTVTSGMEVVDAICENVPSADLVDTEDQPVITSIKVVD